VVSCAIIACNSVVNAHETTALVAKVVLIYRWATNGAIMFDCHTFKAPEPVCVILCILKQCVVLKTIVKCMFNKFVK